MKNKLAIILAIVSVSGVCFAGCSRSSSVNGVKNPDSVVSVLQSSEDDQRVLSEAQQAVKKAIKRKYQNAVIGFLEHIKDKSESWYYFWVKGVYIPVDHGRTYPQETFEEFYEVLIGDPSNMRKIPKTQFFDEFN